MSKIKVLFFATLRQAAGMKELELEIPEELTVQGLLDRLSLDHPGLHVYLPTALVAINREFAFKDARVPPDSEVGLFPPVSGG